MEKIKAKLEDEFLPDDDNDSLFDQLVNCKRGNFIVDEYTESLHDPLV